MSKIVNEILDRIEAKIRQSCELQSTADSLNRLLIERATTIQTLNADLQVVRTELDQVRARRDVLGARLDARIAEDSQRRKQECEADKHITELYFSAQHLVRNAKVPAARRAAITRLIAALAAAEPHVDTIPF